MNSALSKRSCNCTCLADCFHRQSLDSYRQRPNYRQSTESASYAQRPRHRYQPCLYSSYPQCPSLPLQHQTPFAPLSWTQTPTHISVVLLFIRLSALSWCIAGNHSTSLVRVQTTDSISTQTSTHITSASGTMQTHTRSPDLTRPVLRSWILWFGPT